MRRCFRSATGTRAFSGRAVVDQARVLARDLVSARRKAGVPFRPLALIVFDNCRITANKTGDMPKARKALSDWEAPYVQALMKLIETQSKITLAHWAVDYSEQAMLPLWTKSYPEDVRPQEALRVARDWLAGSTKLPRARPAILQCHAAAREAEGNPVAQAAARAIGHAASTIHSARHAIGLAMYGAIAVGYDTLGTAATWTQLERCAAEECGRMLRALRAVAVKNEPNPAKLNWKR